MAILRDRPDLDDEQKRAIFVDGPARFYGLDLDALLAELGPGWSRDLPIAEIPNMTSP